MAKNQFEGYFVVTEKNAGVEEAPYLVPNLEKLARKYTPHLNVGKFQELVLSLDPWTLGVSVRAAVAADAKEFQEDGELLEAVEEYRNHKEILKRQNSARADVIMHSCYAQVKDVAGLKRFLEKTKLTTAQLLTLNKLTSNLVNASTEWIDIYADLVVERATEYRTVSGEKTRRSKADVLAEWR